MYFVPDPTTAFMSEEEFAARIGIITQKLEQCRSSGRFCGAKKKELYYEYFLAEHSIGSVVVVHGLSEFTKKYYEFAYYLLNRGYNVFLYDQRCHGYSDRLTKDPELIHVDRFQDYADDLNTYIEQIVLPASQQPLYLYSHSMGGAIAVCYLAQHTDRIKKAVVSAPLFEPFVGNVSLTVARMGIKFLNIILGPKRKYRYSKEFNPEFPFEKSADGSYARFRYNMDMRIADLHYRTTPMSLGWVYNSLTIRPHVLHDRVAKQIKTPILLLSAQHDTVVKSEPHAAFAAACPMCQLVCVENANHSMLTGTPEIFAEHLTRTFDFFAQ